MSSNSVVPNSKVFWDISPQGGRRGSSVLLLIISTCLQMTLKILEYLLHLHSFKTVQLGADSKFSKISSCIYTFYSVNVFLQASWLWLVIVKSKKINSISIFNTIYVVYYTEMRVKLLIGHRIVGAKLVINPFKVNFLYLCFSNINHALHCWMLCLHRNWQH